VVSTDGSGAGDEDAEATQRTPPRQRRVGVRDRDGVAHAKEKRRAPAAREEQGAPRKARPAAMAVETGRRRDARGFWVVFVTEWRGWGGVGYGLEVMVVAGLDVTTGVDGLIYWTYAWPRKRFFKDFAGCNRGR
jgi:hypothetical protein